MGRHVDHPEGMFCFAELHTGVDAETATGFYGELFGWTLAPVSDGYSIWRLDGRDVVGVRQAGGDARWIPYVRVADRVAFAARAASRGATIVAPAADVPGVARTCLLGDPDGATLGLWEPDGVGGTAVDSGPGSLWWVELASPDMERSARHYASVFDWSPVHTMKFENSPRGYILWKIGDRSTSGVFQYEPEWGMTPMWTVYFQVADFEATAARACALGGEQGFWRDVPNVGRIGTIFDPSGTAFLMAQEKTGSG
jgi:predicted enzyme related to lactoylglutathione lyase